MCIHSNDTSCVSENSQFTRQTLLLSQITNKYVRTNNLGIDASFENALVDEHAVHRQNKKQSLYDAIGIDDNYALPAGIFSRFLEQDADIVLDGTKDCAEWMSGSRRSLLPLQNTFLDRSFLHYVFVGPEGGISSGVGIEGQPVVLVLVLVLLCNCQGNNASVRDGLGFDQVCLCR